MRGALILTALLGTAAMAQQSQAPEQDSATQATPTKPAATETRAPAQPAPAAQPSTTEAAASTDAAPRSARHTTDRIELESTEIRGNRELPKVLYIVPWKRPDPGELGGKPMNSLLDEVLQPIDRDVFRRENRYYRALRPDEAAAPNASAPPTGQE